MRKLCVIALLFACQRAAVRGVDAEASAPEQLDFGQVAVGDTKVLPVVVADVSALPLALQSAGADAPFSVSGAPASIGPGGQATLQVLFAPRAAGDFDQPLAVGLDSRVTPALTVRLRGTGVATAGPPPPVPTPAALSVAPRARSFSLTLPSVSTAQALTVSNTGELSLTWSAAVDGTELSLSPSSGALAGGQSATVTVSLSATAAVHAVRNITFTSSANGQVVPVTLAVEEAGPPPPGPVPPALLVEPQALSLLAQLPNAPAPQPFRVHNTGGGTLHWSVTPASGLTLSLGSGALAGGESATVTVGAASVPLLPLSFTRTLTVATDEAGAQDVTVSVTFTPPAPPPQYGGSVWPKFHQGNTCTGLSSVATATRGQLRFRSQFGPSRNASGQGTYVGSPALAADGTVYQLGGDGFNGTITAFDPHTGGARWSTAVTSPAAISPSIEATPTVVKDGSIFVMTGAESADTHFYKLAPDGSVLWQEPFGSGYGDGFDSSPAIGADGTLWLAFDEAPGVVLFTQGDAATQPHEIGRVGFPGGTDIESQSGAIADDGVAYWSDDGVLRAMDAGGALWTHDGQDGDFAWVHSRSAPLLTPGGVVVFARANRDPGSGLVTTAVVAVTGGRSGGARLWRTVLGPTAPVAPLGPTGSLDLDDRVALSSPAMGPDGAIYIGHADGLYRLDPSTGAVQWRAGAALVASSPAVGADGTVFFGSMDGKLSAVNPAGRVLWTVQTGGEVNSSPAIGADGAVFVASDDGYLYAVE